MSELPPLPDDLKVPEEWQGLAPHALSGTLMLVGATDTGKSTLARWLIEQARSCGRIAAWLDADLGQSSLGIPGTLNLALFAGTSFTATERAAYFVGSSSPRGHMLQVLTGLCRLSDFARLNGADLVILDTSGLVAHEVGGGALKEWEVEHLRPSTVIALQREQELNHLLSPWRQDPRFRLEILPIAPGVRCRSPQERTKRRRALLRHYFAGAKTLRIAKGFPIYGLQNAEAGCLAGLIDREGLLHGAGVVKQIFSDRLELLSRCRSLEQVALVRLGRLYIDPWSGVELQRDKFSASRKG